MPPLPPVPQVLKIITAGYVDNEDIYGWANVLHFKYSGSAPSNANCATIGTDVAGYWTTRMAPQCPSPTHLTNVNVIDLTSATSGQWDTVVDIAGTRGDDSIPANAAMLMSYPVGTRYRGGHPRQYLYVGGNADLEGAAKWASSFLSAVLLAWQEFLGDISSTTVGSTVLGQFGAVSYISKEENPVPPYRRTTPVFLPLDTSLTRVRAEMASQRGRIGRRRS